ncbi:MAG: hypothetical protein HQL57_08465 [Magnetococcales bacterium]|nr:hypothetical protein [Magnetococcales bacterium]
MLSEIDRFQMRFSKPCLCGYLAPALLIFWSGVYTNFYDLKFRLYEPSRTAGAIWLFVVTVVVYVLSKILANYSKRCLLPSAAIAYSAWRVAAFVVISQNYVMVMVAIQTLLFLTVR